MLVSSALHFARGRAAAGALPQQPAPPVGCMQVELWPAQRTRFMFGFTVKTCDRASSAPASSHLYLTLRTASRCNAGILRRVMSGYGGKVQVRWLLRTRAKRLFFLSRAAANSGGLSGQARASTAAQPAACRLHPSLTPPVFLRLPLPLESLARTTYALLRRRETFRSLEITFSRTPNA
jgi:hypothetical protein